MLANIPSNIIAVVIVLGFLVFAHEAGHFLVAKLFRVRVLVFSFGFGTRLFGFKRGDTDYRVSLIPLGGYVRMAGDSPEEEREGLPDEFLSRPKWQRFLILLAGPLANAVIALLFLAIFLMLGTEVVRDSEPVIGVVIPDKPAAAAGLQVGDRIVSVDGDPIDRWEDLKIAIGMHPADPVSLTYERKGARHTIEITPERVMTDYGASGVIGINPWFKPEVGRVLEGSAAAKAGLLEGDSIFAVNGKPVEQMADIEKLLDEAKERPLIFDVHRGGKSVRLTLPSMKEAGEPYPGFGIPTTTLKYPLGQALRESFKENVKLTRYIFLVLGRLVRFEGSMRDFSGPVSIARISGEMLRSGFNYMIYLMASISLNLAILNLLPIPVLDGGHIAILCVEGVMRRELSLRTKERIFQIGFAVLAALMLVVIYNDVIQNVMLMRKG